MYLKSIEIQGFKSFANKLVFEFHNGITGIVGPNGSGKSNISDAIRWVLGEQSPKMLRGGKMEEVIFSGTASRKSRGMAEVTLVIDNTAGRIKFSLGFCFFAFVHYNAGSFFKDLSSALRFAADYLRYLTLAYYRIAVYTYAGIHYQFPYVSQSALIVVYQIFAFSRTVHSPGYGSLHA